MYLVSFLFAIFFYDPCVWDVLVGVQESMLNAPIGVCSFGAFGYLGFAVTEHEPNVEVGVLRFD